MLRHWLISVFAIFGTITATEVSKGQEDKQANKEIEVVDLTKYQYDLALFAPVVETTAPTTTTTVPQKPVKKQVVNDEEKSCPEWEPMFKQYGLVPVKTFSYIAWRESRCRPKAVNAKWDSKGNVVWTLNKDGSIDRGMFQVNSSWKTVTSQVCRSEYGDMEVLFNVDCNFKVAKYLLDNGGLGHWGM